VSSGDQIIVRGQPRGGPPKEKIVIFSDLDAGKVAKRANPNSDAGETQDGEYAWSARENLRQKIVGKEVYFKVQDAPSADSRTTRSFGVVFLGSDETGENLTEWSVSSGNCQLRETVRKQIDQAASRNPDGEDSDNVTHLKKLVALEEKAREDKIGRWAQPGVPQRSNIQWTIENPEAFIESNRKIPLPGVLEYVFNASMVRIYLSSVNAYVTMSLTGIRAPVEKGPTGSPEDFFAIAKYTVESRLLNQDINVLIEGMAPNINKSAQKEPLFVGTIQHSNGNIAELLLKEGYAKCVDWSMGMLVGESSKYRNAERAAKLAKKRMWKNWQPADANIPEDERDFQAKVVQIVNSDSLAVETASGVKQIYLASVRPARIEDLADELQSKARSNEKSAQANRSKALYTVPFLFEAREFLRKRLIGKKVQVKIDYKREAHTDQGRHYGERLCATVTYQGQNIAEALVAKGYAVPIRHRHDDDNRSSAYDELRKAEDKAIKEQKGIRAKTLPDPMRVADVSGEVPKARAFLPFLKGKKSEAVVDFVFSGSRLKLYIPKETCLITFLIGGIECPRGERPNRDVPNTMIPGDEYSKEATDLTKELIQQRDVIVEVETMDKVGGFVGYVFVDKVNVSIKLVEAGLSKVHYSGEQGKYANELLAAQERAQTARLGLWKNWEPPKEVEEVVVSNGNAEPTSRNVDPKEIAITEVTSNMCFYGQYIANGAKLEELTKQLRNQFAENPPTAGSYTPKRNQICAAIFPEDGLWYRGKIEKISREGMATITFIDYGNRALVEKTQLAELPAAVSCDVLEGQAKEFQLALVKPPADEDSLNIALNEFISMLGDDPYSVNDEGMKEGNTYQVTLTNGKGDDIGEQLLKNGFCTTVKKAPRHLADLHAKYVEVQNVAKKQHLNLWRYGDITEDDDKEFGMNSEVVKSK